MNFRCEYCCLCSVVLHRCVEIKEVVFILSTNLAMLKILRHQMFCYWRQSVVPDWGVSDTNINSLMSGSHLKKFSPIFSLTKDGLNRLKDLLKGNYWLHMGACSNQNFLTVHWLLSMIYSAQRHACCNWLFELQGHFHVASNSPFFVPFKSVFSALLWYCFFLVGPLIPFFWLLVTSALGFKARVDPSLACFLACSQRMPSVVLFTHSIKKIQGCRSQKRWCWRYV